MHDFQTITNRLHTQSLKWDDTKKVFGTNDLLPMWVADMDFPSPKEVNDALIKRAEHGVYGYTVIDAEITNQVTSWLKNRHQWEVDNQWITFSPSVMTSIYFAIINFTKENDKVLIQTPVYTPFFQVVKESKRQLVENPLHYNGTSYEIDFIDLENKFKQGVKAFIFCSPHNPVGRVWTKAELEKLGNLCVKYDVLILADEIHADLVYSPNKHISIATISEAINDRTITFMSPTKSFNLAGLQVSYIVCANRKRRMILENQLIVVGFRMLNTMGVIALDAAYRYGELWLNELIDVLEKNKHDAIARLTKETNGKLRVIDAEGTYLLWIDCKQLGMDDSELKQFFIQKAKVGLNPGTSYGDEGSQFMRLNVGCPPATLTEGLNRIVNAVNQL